MAAKFSVSTYRYKQTYGVSPRGFRLWYFLMPGGRTFCHRGEYNEAVREATAHASRLPLSQETVLQVYA